MTTLWHHAITVGDVVIGIGVCLVVTIVISLVVNFLLSLNSDI